MWRPYKVSPYIIIVQVIFCFIEPFLVILKIEYRFRGHMQPRKLQCCIWRDSVKLSLRFSWFWVFFVSKSNPFLILFYSTVDCVVPRGGRKKPPVHRHSAGYIFFSFWIIEPILVILKIEYRFGGRGGGCVCSLANYSVAYKETQSNRVSNFRDFVSSLFQ